MNEGLRKWLHKQDMTQAELAAALGLSRVYINRIINRFDCPSDAFLWRFYSCYGQDATIEAFDVVNETPA